jgi:GH24 family phage-related lysozyme (muramidase)
MRAIPPGASAFVQKHEGLRLESYQDSGGVWTEKNVARTIG